MVRKLKKRSGETVQVAFRLSQSLLDDIDEYGKLFCDKNPGLTMSRADTVRLLLRSALEQTKSGDT